MYERFTDRARRVMKLAARQAQRFNHEYIGTEHILLGLLEEGEGVAAMVLKNLKVDLQKIRVKIETFVTAGPGGLRVALRRMPHTPRAKKAVEYAILAARNLNHNYIGTEHLLLGLLRERDGVAADILLAVGLTVEKVGDEIIRLPPRPTASRARSQLGGFLRRLFGRSGGRAPAPRPERPTTHEVAGDGPPAGP